MAAKAICDLADCEKDELLCTYSMLALHDDGADITPEAMNAAVLELFCGAPVEIDVATSRTAPKRPPRRAFFSCASMWPIAL